MDRIAGAVQVAVRLLLSCALVLVFMAPSAALSSAPAFAAEGSAASAAKSDAAVPKTDNSTGKSDSSSDKNDNSKASSDTSAKSDEARDKSDASPDKPDANSPSDEKEDAVSKLDSAGSASSASSNEGDSDAAKEQPSDASSKAQGDGGEDAKADGDAEADDASGSSGSAEAVPDAEDAGEAALVTASAKPTRALGAVKGAEGEDEPVLKSARLLMMNPTTKEYEPFDKTTTEDKPRKVAAVRDAAYFDVELTYSDGSKKRASKAGVKVTWKLDNAVKDGKAVASVNDEGKVSLLGVSSKLVQLKARISGAKVVGSPAYVNLVSDVTAPDSGKKIDSVAVTYSGSGEGASTCAVAPANDVAATGDGVAEEDVPAITQAGGSLGLRASVTFIDAAGNKQTSAGSDAGAQLVWQIVALYDEMQERTNTIIALVSQGGQDAQLTATQSGNGWVAVRCASVAFPDYVGQELLVRIANNDAAGAAALAANTFTSANLVYEDPSTGSYKPYSGTIANTPTVISTPGGSVGFDAELTFADGSSALASQRGLAVDYAVAGGVSAGTEIATMAPDGTLTATNQKNGTPRIASATVNGMAVAGTPAYVRIANNDASIKPASSSLEITALSNYWVGASQRPDDAAQDWYWRAVPTSRMGAVPLVVSAPSGASSCRLSAAVRWTNSTVTSSQDQDGGVRSWSVAKSVDYDGKPCSTLVTVGSDGTVRPVGSKSGYATVRCTVELPVYDAAGNRTTINLSGEFKVAVYASQNYVKKIVLLDEKGSPIQTSSIKLASGKNTYNFAALITYVGYNEETHRVEEYEVNTKTDTQKALGLTWKVYRSEERAQDELYSQIRDDGSFRALSGFARGFVYANIARASFTGKDIGVGVNVIAEDSIESLGHTDSMTVSMYHYSDYMKHGDGAKPAKEVELSRGQLAGLADYTTWYTFQRRGDAFSTVYAQGLTMHTLLAVCGVDPDRLISMAFTGVDGYFAERHSASFILGTQYRYTNYYYHKDLPGLVGAQSVSPMFALSYYMKNNAGYEDATDRNNAGAAGYGYMSSDSTFRVIFGMTGMGIRNAGQSISNVNRITIIVEDNTFPLDEEKEPEPEPKPDDPDDPIPPSEEQNGTPGKQGTSDGDESANPFNGDSDEGVGTDAKQGGTVAVSKDGDSAEAGEKDATNDHNDDKGSASGQSTQDSEDVKGETDQSGNPLIRELRENPRPVIPPAEIDAIWWTLVALVALAALFFGGMFQGRRYAIDRTDGVIIRMRSS